MPVPVRSQSTGEIIVIRDNEDIPPGFDPVYSVETACPALPPPCACNGNGGKGFLLFIAITVAFGLGWALRS